MHAELYQYPAKLVGRNLPINRAHLVGHVWLVFQEILYRFKLVGSRNCFSSVGPCQQFRFSRLPPLCGNSMKSLFDLLMKTTWICTNIGLPVICHYCALLLYNPVNPNKQVNLFKSIPQQVLFILRPKISKFYISTFLVGNQQEKHAELYQYPA